MSKHKSFTDTDLTELFKSACHLDQLEAAEICWEDKRDDIAYMLYECAARGGVADAQIAMGSDSFNNGQIDDAIRWFKIAAQNCDEQALFELDGLAGALFLELKELDDYDAIQEIRDLSHFVNNINTLHSTPLPFPDTCLFSFDYEM